MRSRPNVLPFWRCARFTIFRSVFQKRRGCRTQCPAAASPQPSACRDRRQRGSEEHTSELQSLMRISYAVFCLKKKKKKQDHKPLSKSTSDQAEKLVYKHTKYTLLIPH